MTRAAPQAVRAPEAQVHAVTRVLKGPGQALPAQLQQMMESSFGADFSSVRVHADGDAERSARALQAQAWTLGEHIAFSAGRWSPETSAGQFLVAHELAHVIQQRGGPGMGSSGGDHTAIERSADLAAGLAVSGAAPARVQQISSNLPPAQGIQCRAEQAATTTQDTPSFETKWREVEVGKQKVSYPKESSVALDTLVPGKHTRVHLHVFSVNLGQNKYGVLIRLYYQETGMWQEFDIPAFFAEPVVPKLLQLKPLQAVVDLGAPTEGKHRNLEITAEPAEGGRDLYFGCSYGSHMWFFVAKAEERKRHGEPGFLGRMLDYLVQVVAIPTTAAVTGGAAVYDLATGQQGHAESIQKQWLEPTLAGDFQAVTDLRMAMRDAGEIDTRSLDYLDVLLEGCEEALLWIFGGKMIEWMVGIFRWLRGLGENVIWWLVRKMMDMRGGPAALAALKWLMKTVGEGAVHYAGAFGKGIVRNLNKAKAFAGEAAGRGVKALESTRAGKPVVGAFRWVGKKLAGLSKPKPQVEREFPVENPLPGEPTTKKIVYDQREMINPETGAKELVEDVTHDPFKESWKWLGPTPQKGGTQVSMAFAAIQNIVAQATRKDDPARKWEDFNKKSIFMDVAFAAVGQTFARQTCKTWQIGIKPDIVPEKWLKDLAINQAAFYVYGLVSSIMRAKAAKADQDKMQLSTLLEGGFSLAIGIATDSLLLTQEGKELFPQGRDDGNLNLISKMLSQIWKLGVNQTIGLSAHK